MKINNKEYMLVNDRVSIFKDRYSTWSIATEIVSIADGIVIMKATVADENGMVKATGHAYEKENSTFINKTSYIENCETSAVGRALGFLGIGIDSSIASAEEVQNAMLNQNKEVNPFEDEENEPITKVMAKRISDIIALDKTPEQAGRLAAELYKEFGIKKVTDLKNYQYPDAVKWLEGKK